MTDAILLFRRSLLLLTLCGTLLPFAACKKKEDAAAGTPGATPAEGTPAEPTPKEEPPAELKALWTEGQRLVVQVVTQTDTETTNPALPQPIKSESLTAQEIAFTASKEREAGGREVDVEIVSLRGESKAGGKTIPIFDPKSDPKSDRTNATAGAIRKLLGSHVKYQVDTNGNISKVDGLPQLLTRVTTGLQPMGQIYVRGLLTEDAIRGWNTLHQGLPTNSVKAGDTWESTRDMPFGVAKFAMNTTNTFKGWEQRNNKKVAKFESVGVIAPKGAATNPGPITIADGATISGSSWYDPAVGGIVESETTANFSVTISQATGQSIASKLKTKTTSKLIAGGVAGAEPAAAPPAAAKPAEKPCTPGASSSSRCW